MMQRFQCMPCLIFLIIANLIPATVCLAEEALQIFEDERRIVLSGEISKALGIYEEHLQGAVEYLICARGGKEYESIIIVESAAKEIYDAMIKLGVKKGTPPGYDEEQDTELPPTGTGVLLFIEWTANGESKRVRGEDLLYNKRTQKPMKHVAWIFSASRMIPDLESEAEDAMIPQAFMSNDVIALNHLDGSALFQNPLPEAAKENTYLKNEKRLPPLGTPVKVTIEVNQKLQRYVLVSGTVQGVGFRNFTKQNAAKLGIGGYAKNLPNGKVEVVAEADKATLDQFITILWEGPRASGVEDVKVEERPFSGEYTDFMIRY